MKRSLILPLILMLLLALTRIPGLMPQNFSAIYALAFCGGVYFSGAMAWWLPMGVLLGTDILLNVFYYDVSVFTPQMAVKTLAFLGLIALGRLFSPHSNLFKLVGGGIFGAILFYLITNTAAWLSDPAYVKTIAGWIQALTWGRPDVHPTTLEFFRNTLLGAGFFTALFVGTMKLTASESPQEKEAGVREPESAPEGDTPPEEAKA